MRRGLNGGVLGGAILLAVGVFVVWHAQTALAFGTLRRMGPGFLPTVLGTLLAGLGLLILVAGLFSTERLPKVDGWGAAFVLGGIVAFGLMLPVAGMLLSSFVTVLIVLVPDRNFTPLAKLATALGVAGLTYAIFSLGLRMNLPVWPWR
jgi:hypothetical protein